MKRTILLHPDPRLKKICAPVTNITAELRKLADDMLETMYDAPGIGLAAPQIGFLQRMIVMDCAKKEDTDPAPLIMFNPEITSSSQESEIYEEGCLSIPEHYAEISRPKEVEAKWIDAEGKEQIKVFNGLWSTCLQHEIDHLNGKLFIDYLSSIKRQLITQKMKKLKREFARNKEF